MYGLSYNRRKLIQRFVTVLHTEQIALGEQLFEYIETKTTAVCAEIYQQPVSEYTCGVQAAAEKQRFFRDSLLCLGLSARLPNPGSYFTDRLSGVPILLTRGADGTVNGFMNVCRHRGSAVATESGNARSFVCPYHAWTYNLKGQLIARPEDQSFAGMDRQSHGLRPLSVVESNGMLWVCPTPGKSEDLDTKLAGLEPELAAYDLGSFHHFDSCLIRRAMNWKLIVDTFLESYHFCVLHRNTICSIFHDNLSAFDSWGDNFRLVSARRTISELKNSNPSDWNILPHIVGIYVLFPNTVLVWQLDHVELWHIYPDENDTDHSVVRVDLYTPEAAVTEKAQQYWKKNLDLVVKVVQEEDFPVGETIQNGFHSMAQTHVTFGTNEPALAHFHRSISKALSQP
ncbi:MAG: phenylpropionate dioxygenase-like ring-hydroxylating dioxygenase large terminal subunit [Gammaproteobacteria bacterium]